MSQSLTSAKIPWSGVLTSVQPRIYLSRSFDQRSHSYLGYVLRVDGDIGGERRQFLVAVGKSAHAKHQFQSGDNVSGVGLAVADGRRETAELYKVSQLKVLSKTTTEGRSEGPPWRGIAPELPVYRARGHRRLAMRTFKSKCQSCIWASQMAVEMILDHWNPQQRRYRIETFCYGPLSCPLYKAGATRKVPGRRGMTYEEEDWIDEDATSHRPPDE